MSLMVKEQLIAAQVQALGNTHRLCRGYSSGGAMDEIAFRWNAHLLKTDPNMGQIEVYQGGFKALFTKDTTFSIAGADLNTTLNEKRISNWCMHHAYEGDVIHMAHATNGMRGYLAVAGGFKLDDPNTVVRLKTGGLNGDTLKANDELPFEPKKMDIVRGVRWTHLPDYQAPLTLHIIPGFQIDYFSERAVDTLLNNTFEITARNDRMGICLAGVPISYDGPKLPSEGITFGSIQIPADGAPIILMRDAQSIGGYPKLGSVFSLDCALLSQKPAGTDVQFQLMSAEQAIDVREKIISAIENY